MSDKPTILLVEDDDFLAEVTVGSLADEYLVQHVNNGQAALDVVSLHAPDLILLDVSLPGMSGYEVCQAMRDDPGLEGLPILFLSGLDSEAERLAGYQAGGDDYLIKPVSFGELRSKIKLALGQYRERQRLKVDASSAFSTAMTAMTSMAEVGAVLQFLRTSFNCSHYAQLCRELLNTLDSFGLCAQAQIRGRQGTLSLGVAGPCTPLEESTLTTMSKQDRLFSFGSHTSCNYEHITIIVKNMPIKDAEQYGRTKDNLALLAEGADARIMALDAEINLVKQHHALKYLIANTRNTLKEIERNRQTQQAKNSAILENFRHQLERSFLKLGLTESQEEELITLAEQASEQALALYEEGLIVEDRMENLLKQLETAGE